MEGRQIKIILSHLFSKRNKKILIFSFDCFVNYAHTNEFDENTIFIVNEATSFDQSGGLHWFLVTRKGENIFLLDSMKKTRIELAVSREFPQHTFVYLPEKLQHSASHCCGVYSIFFAIQFCLLNRPLATLLRHFNSSATADNCRFVVRWVQLYINVARRLR